jgi:hypothetical protein
MNRVPASVGTYRQYPLPFLISDRRSSDPKVSADVREPSAGSFRPALSPSPRISSPKPSLVAYRNRCGSPSPRWRYSIRENRRSQRRCSSGFCVTRQTSSSRALWRIST